MRLVFTSASVGILVLAVLSFATPCLASESPVNKHNLLRTDDDRCGKVECDSFGDDVPTDFEFAADNTTCQNRTTVGTDDNGGNCPKCLTDPMWTAQLEAIGLGSSTRTVTPVLIIDDWLSGDVGDTIATIIMREAMGLTVDTLPMYINGNTEIVCCKKNIIQLQKWWGEGTVLPDDPQFSLKTGSIGYPGEVGLYVPAHTAAAYPLATAYGAYKFLPEYTKIMPKGNSTDCSLLIDDTSRGCVEGNFFCDWGSKANYGNLWPNTSCTFGRYIPPQCEGNWTNCTEVLMADPTWDTGFFEGLIKNLNLPFVTTYLSYATLRKEVKARSDRGEHFIFYAFRPDPLVSSVGGQAINFPPYNYECGQKGNNDPTLNGGDCGFPNPNVQKMARRDWLAEDKDIEFFFESFFFPASELNKLMAQLPEAGGTRSVYNLSCDWVRNNYVLWKDWVKNTPPPNATIFASSNSDTGMIVGVSVGVPIAVIILGVIVVAVVLRHRAALAVKFAPKKPPMAVMFTDIESSTMLWEQYGDEMGKAVALHQDIIRGVFERFRCYEVKTSGDSFIAASKNLVNMTLAAVEIQKQLEEAKWPAALVHWKKEDDNPGMRGLRVRMGVHFCREIDAKFDPVHKRYDYYGNDMNVSARVLAIGAGGQILMTEETWVVLSRDESYSALKEDIDFRRVSDGVEFKGLSDKEPVYQFLPVEMANRHFPPLEGAPKGEEMDPTSFDAASLASSAGGEEEKHKAMKIVLDEAIRAMAGKSAGGKQGDTVVEKMANNLGVRAGPTVLRKAGIRKLIFSKALQQGTGVGASQSPRHHANHLRLPGHANQANNPLVEGNL